MNKDLAAEEFDRELALKPSNGSIYASDKVAIGNKNISFTTRHHELMLSPPYGKHCHKTRITFKKENNAQADQIEIFVERFEKKQREKKCDLGHVHHTEDYEFAEWQRIYLSWDQFDQLLEWFKTGRFYDPRSRQAKKLGSKTGFHSKKVLK